MRINGQWVGWGLGDNSTSDMTVRNAKAFMRRMYKSYAGNLADTNLFDEQMFTAVKEMQRRLEQGGHLTAGKYVVGVLDLPTQIAMGFKKPPVDPNPKRPIVITVEGHMSDMWIGPAAAIGEQLEAEGLCWHQPTSYDRTSLPFNDASGVNEVLRFLGQTTLDSGRQFPPDLDWNLLGFSQGSIITNQVWMEHLKNAPAGSLLAARRDHLKRAIAFGDPWREKDHIAEWVPDPPNAGTQGISDKRMVDTPPWWKSHSRHGDLYSENPDSSVGLDRTAIYKIAVDNSWIGGPAAIFTRILTELKDPLPETISIIRAILGGVMFLGNMAPHGMYQLDAPTDYIRQGLLLDHAA